MDGNLSAGRARIPLLERPFAAVLLACTAGLMNAYTFGATGTFATVQSGNIVSVGYYLVAGDGAHVLHALLAIVSFAAGAFACTVVVLATTRGRRAYSGYILVFEAAALVVLGLWATHMGADPLGVAWSISFLAGIQGAAFHRESGMLYGNVAVTFVLQMVGSLLGRAVGRRIVDDGEYHLRPAVAYLWVLIAFAGGGGFGFALDRFLPSGSLFAASAILVFLALRARLHRGPVDPAQNAPTP